MGERAASAALNDAGICYDKVEAVVASYCYGDPTCGKFCNLYEHMVFTEECSVLAGQKAVYGKYSRSPVWRSLLMD